MATVFIDGQVGTTGIEISERLSSRSDIELISLANDERKSPSARTRLLQQADVAILCLPDDAAVESVALADGETRILDASTAHRTNPEWVYGLAELSPTARAEIANAQFVSNPGCYPQGFVLLTRPLIQAGLLSASTPLRCHALSGYSGGGRQMIEKFRDFSPVQADTLGVQSYAHGQQHKHLPEMLSYSGTAVQPIFTPSVANYYRGMLVEVPLFASELNNSSPEQVLEVLQQRYADEPFINVASLGAEELMDGGFLNPTDCNDSNRMDLVLMGDAQRIILCARYDNLGKGAAGAAVQNLNIMLGIKESSGL
jgi:N-acetyl-gamma-glutamyl-phosphate reductase